MEGGGAALPFAWAGGEGAGPGPARPPGICPVELSLAGEGRGGMVLLQSGCSEYRLAHGWTGFELRAAPLSRTSHWLVKTKDSVMEKRPAWS